MNSGYAQPPFFLEKFPSQELDSLSMEQINMMDRFDQQGGVFPSGGFDLGSLDPSLMASPLQTQGAALTAHLPTQQHPMARFVGEHQRPLFTMPTLYNQQQSRGLARQATPVGSLPYANQGRIASPSPSQGLTSNSSALSPPGDSEFSQDLAFSFSPHPPNDFSPFEYHIRQGPVSWSGQPTQGYPPQQFAQDSECVNLRQVQGFADNTEMSFEASGYGMGGQEYNGGVNTGQTIHVDSSRHNSYYIDEGIGSSIHDNPTPKSMAASYHDQEERDEEDVDAEGDAEQDTVIVDTGDDTDYLPTGKSPRRNKARRSAKPFNPLGANTKNARVTKSAPKSKLGHACRVCDAGSFKDASTLAKHTATNHTRAFACVFKFAGCDATFGSKNEWKRHVQSQHLNLTAWLCTQGSCGKAHGPKGNPTVGSEFNRKDLFTQHVRRMHVPAGVKKKLQKTATGKDIPDPDFEAALKKLQVNCLIIKRRGPDKLSCPVPGCQHLFQGQNPWDECMEHIGKHVEKGKGAKVDIRSERDDNLVVWALTEGVIAKKVNGGYRLGVSGPALPHSHPHPQSQVLVHDDEDAEGEVDD